MSQGSGQLPEIDPDTDRQWWRRWWVLLVIALAIGIALLYVAFPGFREGVDRGLESTLFLG